LKVSIIFHSVCGNTYLLAKEIYKDFSDKGADADIYRVKDEDLEKVITDLPAVGEYYEEISRIPIASPEVIINSDFIFIGSPTYFGNVSAEMKEFMDSFAPIWAEAKLFGKRLVAFSTCGTSEGGGDMCLRAINTFGQHMGMLSVPIPSNLVPGINNPAYGLLHYTGDEGNRRIGEDMKKSVASLVEIIVKGVL
jgi:NAD(P)H dehydrogenase (quinone)